MNADAAENPAIIQFGDKKGESMLRVKFSQIASPKFGHIIPKISQKQEKLQNGENKEKQREDPCQLIAEREVVTETNADD